MSQVLKEIGKALRRSHPDKAICVREEYWCYSNGTVSHEYHVSMVMKQAGPNGTLCSGHKFNSFQELSDWAHERSREDSLSSAADTPPS
jgi:hypothetical protein